MFVKKHVLTIRASLANTATIAGIISAGVAFRLFVRFIVFFFGGGTASANMHFFSGGYDRGGKRGDIFRGAIINFPAR